jgi:acetyl-CoA carboxylase biotin carboxyl carrier protein
MSDADASHDAPFNLEKLTALVELMEKHGLTEVSLQRGSERWRLRRGAVLAAAPPASLAAPPPAATAAPASSPAGPGEQKPPGPEIDGTITINSPTVGTYYSSPTPDDPPFVSVGSRVQPETIVCIVEAMKVFNQIPAEVSGTIVTVLAKNGESVEFGQPLFRVRPG